MVDKQYPVSGAGFGYRRCMSDTLKDADTDAFDFLEIAPENWIGLGGRFGKAFRRYTEQFPFIAHGLSLSIGGPTPLDMEFQDKATIYLTYLKQRRRENNDKPQKPYKIGITEISKTKVGTMVGGNKANNVVKNEIR